MSSRNRQRPLVARNILLILALLGLLLPAPPRRPPPALPSMILPTATWPRCWRRSRTYTAAVEVTVNLAPGGTYTFDQQVGGSHAQHDHQRESDHQRQRRDHRPQQRVRHPGVQLLLDR